MQTNSLTRLVVLLVLFFLPAASSGTDPDAIAVERFSSMPPETPLTGWQPMTFKHIQSHTRYALVDHQGNTVLRADSDASASGLVKEWKIDPEDYPLVTWQWKVSNTLGSGDVTQKSGDDFAARIFIFFGEDAGQQSFFQRTRIAATKILYGLRPPSAALIYVWGNQAEVGSFHPSAYIDQCRMILVESGPAHLNQWRSARRNIINDFRRAFGSDPPPISGVAIMTDTDNTGESATAWYGDIVFNRNNDD